MEKLHEYLKMGRKILDFTILKLGEGRLTLGSLLIAIFLFVVLFFISNRLKLFLEKRLLPRTKLDLNVRQATATLIRYLFLVVGAIIILQMAGIDMTAFNVLAGTVGIGVGLGLQNIANNFISGFVILFEKPIKIGDRIQVGDVTGDVLSINARSTAVLTNDNITIIIPNARILSENVINWSYNDSSVRFKIPVGVSYENDIRKVEEALLDVARNNPDVLKEPAPSANFISYGEYSLNFELRVWSSSLMHRKGKLVSNLNYAIFESFRERKLTFSSPQMAVTLKERKAEEEEEKKEDLNPP